MKTYSYINEQKLVQLIKLLILKKKKKVLHKNNSMLVPFSALWPRQYTPILQIMIQQFSKKNKLLMLYCKTLMRSSMLSQDVNTQTDFLRTI